MNYLISLVNNMKIDNQKYNNYLNFIRTNYPKSGWGNSKKEKLIYMSITNSNTLLDIYSSITKKNNIDLNLLIDLNVLLKHYLFLLPLKSPIAYHAIMRAICECIMKIMYSSIYPTEDVEEIRQLNYRSLSDAVDSDITLKSIISKNTIAIKQTYGDSSKQIHAKSGFTKFDAPYLANFWTKNFISIDTMKNDSNNIYEFVSKTIYVLNKYDSNDFGHNQKIILLSLSEN